MKVKTIILGLSVALLLNNGCKKPDVPPQESQDGIEAMEVPAGFTFETTHELTVNLNVPVNSDNRFNRAKFYIFNGHPDEGGELMSSGGVDPSGNYQAVINQPFAIDSLFISSNLMGLSLGMTEVTGDVFNHNFEYTKALRVKSTTVNRSFTDIISDFENGMDGWMPDGDNSIHLSDHADAPLDAGPLGADDAYLWGFDTRGGLRYFKAPSKFSGDIYGQYLAYHYYLGNTDKARPTQAKIPDIRLTDGKKTLAIDLSPSFIHETNAGWQTYWVKLDETATTGTGWRIGNKNYMNQRNGSKALPKKLANASEIKEILENVTEIHLAPEGQVGYYSSKGPEFIALGSVGVISDIDSFGVYDQGETLDDTDGDGVIDQDDDYPNDPNLAHNNYSPTEDTYGTLGYEDMWPEKGDYDFNDLVVDYNFNLITNADNKVKQIDARFVVQAIGAGFQNGFAFELPVAQSMIESVSGNEIFGSLFTFNENGTEQGNSNAVIVAVDNVSQLFEASGFINTQASVAYYAPDTITMSIVFDQTLTLSELGVAPFNPFIVANQLRGYEIHLAGHENTQLADTDLFGFGMDDTQPGNNKFYQTEQGLPWGIHIPVSFDYPYEKISIEQAHLKFETWVESGGNSFDDWYLDKSGYRNAGNIYQKPD